MNDAEKMLSEFIRDFVNKNWDKIDKDKMDLTITKETFLDDLKSDITDVLWVLYEVAYWGMDKSYLRDIFVPNDEDYPDVVMIGTHYIKIDYSMDKVDFTYPQTRSVTYFK